MKLRPPAFDDLDDDLFERIETLRTVLRERARADRSLTEWAASLLGRDTPNADAAELRRELFGDVTLPPTAKRPVDDALAKVDAGELEAARQIMADAFDSDCDTVMPEAYRVGPTDRTSRCHRHREDETDPRSAVDRERYALDFDSDSDSDFESDFDE